MKHDGSERDGSRRRPGLLGRLAVELFCYSRGGTDFGSSGVGPDGSDEEGWLHFEEFRVGEEVLKVRTDCEEKRMSYKLFWSIFF
jgi:hypothetical protein